LPGFYERLWHRAENLGAAITSTVNGGIRDLAGASVPRPNLTQFGLSVNVE
jgi:hypothetical protein